MAMKISVDLDLCQGHSVCLGECPEVFDVVERDESVLVQVSDDGAGIDSSALKELVICDTINPNEATLASERIRILTIAPLIGEAVGRIADESSVSSLFD